MALLDQGRLEAIAQATQQHCSANGDGNAVAVTSDFEFTIEPTGIVPGNCLYIREPLTAPEVESLLSGYLFRTISSPR